MAAPARSIQDKSLGSPDEAHSFEKRQMEVVMLGEVIVGRATFEPGWRRSECAEPIAGTDGCQGPHVGYMVSGRRSL